MQAWTYPERSRRLRLQEFLDDPHKKVTSLSTLRTGGLYPSQKIFLVLVSVGDRGSTVTKVLCYKSESRLSDPRWFHGIIH
jgi:hypothetical protein